MRAVALTVGLAICLSMPCFASGSPTDEFNRARNAYTFGNYREAIRLLKGLLNPLRLRDRDRIAEARKLLGVCYFFERNYGAARREFERLLYMRPRMRLDPLLIPPPVIDLFEKVREKIKDRLRLLHPERTPTPPQPSVVVRTVERNHMVLNFFPFGVGQFQNRKMGKAVFFLAAQAATLATNLITYSAAESLRRADGSFASEDAGTARGLRIAQIASLSTFGALVVWGIVDSLVDFRGEVINERRVVEPIRGAPSGRKTTPPEKRHRSSGDSYRLQWSPWLGTGVAGIGFSFRFR